MHIIIYNFQRYDLDTAEGLAAYEEAKRIHEKKSNAIKDIKSIKSIMEKKRKEEDEALNF